MEASRSTIMKSILAREGPKTIQQLFVAVKKSFPEQFEEVSRHKFKNVYVKNLKGTQQIQVKPQRDPEALKKLYMDPDSRVTSGQKVAWVLRLNDNIAAKYQEGEISLDTSAKSIVERIDEERSKSKRFWEGATNTPHDWRAALKARGDKTHL
ncbi:hypothetical protein GGF46_000077 [Coemansia sp. RSA 552]|nr:hypothetical protein GGF46_000077 [Coemansia sp. RSA 552]